MMFYQVTIETFKYNLFKRKWVQKCLYPSSLIFSTYVKATSYEKEYIDGLKRRGIKLKEGQFKIHISQLKADFI